jgi:hypothetical protein
MTFETTIEREEGEIDIVVEYDAEPACQGSRDSMGVPLEPDTPATVTVNSATRADTGAPIELEDDEIDKIECEISEQHDAMAYADEPDRYED